MTGLQGGTAAHGLDSEVVRATLEALHPLALPAAPTWWPQTLASLLVIGVFSLLLLDLGAWFWQRWQARAYRREALARLRLLRAALHDPATRERSAREIPELLRCTALAVWPRESVCPLSGKSWLAFLEQSLNPSPGRADQPFSTPLAHVLLELAYVPSPMIDWEKLPALLDLVECWIRRHRPALPEAMPR